MKTAGRMLKVLFVFLLLWSCQALVEKPEPPEIPAELPLMPIRAVWMAAPTEAPVQARAVIAQGETEIRPSPALQQTQDVPVNAPVCDRNGMPLAGRSYVRTAYTACRLEETSG